MGVRPQVLVVVTALWEVLCFDHNLNILWQNSILVCLLPFLCSAISVLL